MANHSDDSGVKFSLARRPRSVPIWKNRYVADAGDQQGRGDGDRALGERSPQRSGSRDGLGFGHGLQRLSDASTQKGGADRRRRVDAWRTRAGRRERSASEPRRQPRAVTRLRRTASALELRLDSSTNCFWSSATRSAVRATRPVPANTASRNHSMTCSALGTSIVRRAIDVWDVDRRQVDGRQVERKLEGQLDLGQVDGGDVNRRHVNNISQSANYCKHSTALHCHGDSMTTVLRRCCQLRDGSRDRAPVASDHRGRRTCSSDPAPVGAPPVVAVVVVHATGTVVRRDARSLARQDYPALSTRLPARRRRPDDDVADAHPRRPARRVRRAARRQPRVRPGGERRARSSSKATTGSSASVMTTSPSIPTPSG